MRTDPSNRPLAYVLYVDFEMVDDAAVLFRNLLREWWRESQVSLEVDAACKLGDAMHRAIVKLQREENADSRVEGLPTVPVVLKKLFDPPISSDRDSTDAVCILDKEQALITRESVKRLDELNRYLNRDSWKKHVNHVMKQPSEELLVLVAIARLLVPQILTGVWRAVTDDSTAPDNWKVNTAKPGKALSESDQQHSNTSDLKHCKVIEAPFSKLKRWYGSLRLTSLNVK